MALCRKVCEILFVYHLCWRIVCLMKVICTGVLQVHPGTVVHMGSELTVLCRSYSERCNRTFSIYLNGELQRPLQVINCSTVSLRLAKVAPKAELLCRVRDRIQQTVCGAVVQSGFPPEKPTGLRCFAQRDSEKVTCTWNNGRETHLLTGHEAAFKFKNGSLAFHHQSHNGSSVCVPRSLFEGDLDFSVRARNDLEEIVSDVISLSLRDIVIPSTPNIITVEFRNNSRMAALHWNISESSGLWRLRVRIGGIRRHPEFCGTGHRQGVVLLEGLEPLSRYEVQIQACSTGEKPKCSQWSSPALYTSPGTAPTKQLDVWRILGNVQENGTRSVTVLWKPFRPEDCRDVMVGHKLVYQEQGQTQVITCPANVTEKMLHVSPNVSEVFVYAVTSTGNSPPAVLPISEAGLTMPHVSDVTPSHEGSVILTWDAYSHDNVSVLGYTVQWQCYYGDIQWKSLAAEENFTLIEGLDPGVRYNITLFAVTTGGVSDPAFRQAYSEEEKPLSGPKISSLNIEGSRIFIQWEELRLEQQRGFITNYTVYVRKRNTGQQSALGTSVSRHMRLNLDMPSNLHVSASNSAGEGPLGEGVFCQLQRLPKDWSDVWLGLMMAVPLVILILVSLMCWDCVQRSIMKTCTMVGPHWLFESFPNVENSTATKLLQENGRSVSESSRRSVDVDPPIAPVEIVTAERTDGHPPAAESESAGVGMGGTASQGDPETGPLLEENHGYKPQITSAAEEEVPEEEENPWVTPLHTGVTPIPCEEDTAYSPHVSGLIRDWLSNVSQDRSGADPDTLGAIHFKGTPPIVLTAGSRPEGGLTELGDSPEDIHLGQTLLPDQLVRCLRSPAINFSPTTFLRELPSMQQSATTEESE